MKQEDIVIGLMKDQNGIITNKEVEALGISTKILTNLLRKNIIRKISKGIYVDKYNFNDKYYEKLARARQGVFSHESALYLHNIIGYEPEKFKITIPSHYNTRIITDEENEFYYHKKTLSSDGIEYINTKENNLVRVYNVHRSICDILKDKNRLSEDRVQEIINIYLHSDKKDLITLKEYATLLNVENDLKIYLGEK